MWHGIQTVIFNKVQRISIPKRLIPETGNVFYLLRTGHFHIQDLGIIGHFKPVEIPVAASHEVSLVAECLLAHTEYAIFICSAGDAEATILRAERRIIPLAGTTVEKRLMIRTNVKR